MANSAICASEQKWKQQLWEALLLSQGCYGAQRATWCGGARSNTRCIALCPLDLQTRCCSEKNLTPKYLSGAGGLMAPSHYKIDLLQNPTSNSYQKWWFVMRSRFTDLQL